MRRAVAGYLALGTALCCAGEMMAKPIQSSARLPAFMRIHGTAQPPHGHLRFCDSGPEHCTTTAGKGIRLDATPERLSELDEINRGVNIMIAPETDLEIYGVTEYWTLPRDRGDCEDYALLKRQLLLARGWPSSSLLLTVVRDEKGEGHAVLTARTVQGDYVLDNKIEDVRLWSMTPYRFVMRQSSMDPRAWVSLTPGTNAVPPAIAGLEHEPR